MTTIGHGGVCAYILDSVIRDFAVDASSVHLPGIDNIVLNVSYNKREVLTILCVYRPRPSPSDSQLCSLLKDLTNKKKNLFVVGDFNMPDVRWPLSSSRDYNSPSGLYVDTIRENNLLQLVSEPTRFRSGQTPSLLDLILVNDPDLVAYHEVLPPFGRSDHVTLSCKIQLNITEPKKVTKRVKVIDYEQLNANLENVDWVSILHSSMDVEVMWSTFVDRLSVECESCTSYRSLTTIPSKPWINKRMLRMLRNKKSMWQRYLRSRRDEDYVAHRIYSNRIKVLLEGAKSSFESNLASSRDRKKFFRYVRSNLNTKVTIPMVRNRQGCESKSAAESAESLSETFAANFIKEHDNLPRTNFAGTQGQLSSVEFPPELVEKHLSSLDIASAPGGDGISARLLKHCATSLSLPLSLIFERSFATHSLPGCWKEALVTPVFKKGDKHDPNNYRPISLIPIISKICEKIIHEKILHFALSNRIIPDNQHGFLPGRSVITNLLSCVNDWSTMLDSQVPVDILYLDFSKAFDRVPHKRLLFKLENLGICGDLLLWIRAFLSNRTFRVRVGDSLSSERDVVSGVPQGSVLGPLLFLLFTSDLPTGLKSTCSLFADDAKIYGNPLTGAHHLQDDLDSILRWCCAWMIPLNIEKCKVLHMGRNNPKRIYHLNQDIIQPVSSHCDLGVTMTEDLSWSEHVVAVTNKAKRMLYMVQKTFGRCDPQTSSFLYSTYVRPILEYAGPVWAPVLSRDKNLLESVQRRATRMPYGVIRPTYEERLDLMGLPTFEARRLRGDLIISYRALHHLFDVDLSVLFTLNPITHLRGHNLKLAKEKFKSASREHFLTNRIFGSWNVLPTYVVNAPSVNAFKNSLDRWLASNAQ